MFNQCVIEDFVGVFIQNNIDKIEVDINEKTIYLGGKK
jgi:hypothetical protein